MVQAIFPKIQAFVDDFHAGKAAGHNENAEANKPVVKDHNTAAQQAKKPSAAVTSEPIKKSPAASTAAGITRGSHRIELKETFYCCALPALLF